MSSNTIPHYSIVVLGPTGSGKTVFLASMYKRLSTQSADISFSIQANASQRTKLVEKYFEVARSGGWPEGTSYNEVSEWNFTCTVRPEKGTSQAALRFSYLDYAGGRLTDVQEDEDEENEFEQQLVKANSLLCILDGQKILALMKNEEDGERFALRELPNILNILDKSDNPIHFIITKWDILYNAYSLAQIRERLLKIDEFHNVVFSRIKNSQVRLIPVSAVGMNFAKLQPDGSMQKIPGQQPNPYQVEVPLCCVLPDHFLAEINRLTDHEKALKQTPLPSRPQLTFWDKIGEYAGGALRIVAKTLQREFDIDEAVFSDLIRFTETSARNKREEFLQEKDQLRAKQAASLAVVTDQKSALQHSIDSFLYIVRKLDADFPASNLSR